MSVLELGDPARPGYVACSGCALCVLPCPVWHQTRDPALTLMGRARALQGGSDARELELSLDACVLCGACEPVCPEGIDTVGMTLGLRRQLGTTGTSSLGEAARNALVKPSAIPADLPLAATRVLVPDRLLHDDDAALAAVVRCLGHEVAVAPSDPAERLSLAIETGIDAPSSLYRAVIDPLSGAREVIVAEGLLVRPLRTRLPGARVIGLGEALLALDAVRRAIRPTDLYIIESRAYHADFERLVKLYDRMREQAGCLTNLDLQRIATPTGAVSAQARLGIVGPVDIAAQIDWILEGRSPRRVVVESLADRAPFAARVACPVLHLAEVA